MKRRGITPVLPPNPAPCIVDWLVEMGITESNGMASVPLSWREIDAWCARTAVDLPPWTGRIIRKLSVAYVSEARKAESETCPPPWRPEGAQAEIDAELALLADILG